MDTTNDHGTDVVKASVLAYGDHVDAYTKHYADAVADASSRFAETLPSGSRILDAGCGPGRDLARFAAAGHHPVGVDLNPEFCAAASAYAYVEHGDLRDLPFDDDEFDGVWACASLVHLPVADAARALAELKRVARPGAPVCVSVKHVGATGWTDTAHGRRWFRIWDVAEFTAAVTAAGLQVGTVETGPVFVDVWARA